MVIGHEKCALGFSLSNGFDWQCQKLPYHFPADPPFCTRDLADNTINQSAFQAWKAREQAYQHKQKMQDESNEAICMTSKTECMRCNHRYFPPQTRQTLPVQRCKNNHGCAAPVSPRQCIRHFIKADIPPVTFDRGNHLLNRQPVNRMDKCVRYENDCMVYALELSNIKPIDAPRGLYWGWTINPKNCAKKTYKVKITEEMQCTSILKETDFMQYQRTQRDNVK